MIKEKERQGSSGWVVLILGIIELAVTIYLAVAAVTSEAVVAAVFWTFLAVVGFVGLLGLFMVNPNEGRVMQLFGKYVGTVKVEGLRWANPFYAKRKISLRVRNFETARMKVNDIDGNPIEIASIVVWKVVDTAEACFHVDNYEMFVAMQSEGAVRNLATRYPYDTHIDNQMSLRGNTAAIAEHMKDEIQERLAQAGVQVIEARISHLAYAPEIAEGMLRRQQAGAIVAARTRIVEGAVGMVEMALERLSSHKIIELDQDRKAAMVSNLLVVLCGEKAVQPVVNTGTIYQ